MSHRFFLDSAPKSNEVVLGGDQAHHAIQVMRFKVDDQVVLFDGSGTEFKAVIKSLTKKQLRLEVVERKEDSKSLATELTLAVAIPKGDRQKFLIEKLVELGVRRLVPLKTTRSVAVANEKVIQRLKKQVVEACKQCERNTLMEVTPQRSLSELVDSLDETESCFVADPYQGQAISSVNENKKSIVVAIGPEGGFDETELQQLIDSKFQPLQIGKAILRVETAALATAAILGIGR